MQLKGGRLYFGSQFQRVQSMVAWPYVLGRASWWQEPVVEDILVSWQTGNTEGIQEGARAG
jgi:hypothetical protein